VVTQAQAAALHLTKKAKNKSQKRFVFFIPDPRK
jgi:hypothetical protein